MAPKICQRIFVLCRKESNGIIMIHTIFCIIMIPFMSRYMIEFTSAWTMILRIRRQNRKYVFSLNDIRVLSPEFPVHILSIWKYRKMRCRFTRLFANICGSLYHNSRTPCYLSQTWADNTTLRKLSHQPLRGFSLRKEGVELSACAYHHAILHAWLLRVQGAARDEAGFTACCF